MNFFDSDLVQSEMIEISKLQEQIYKNMFSYYSMSKEDKINHVELLEKLLDKQKILYTRISLSDDPQAKEMKERISNSAAMMGVPENFDMNIVFNNMSTMLDRMKRNIDMIE
jgi:hypothetical protein